jgi:hypothetical protein
MYKNIKVEAEHNELILENSHGDTVIIPANKRNWVKQKLSEGCHDCIDSLVETLPIASQYAQDGSWFPSWMNPKNWGVTDYSDRKDFSTSYSYARNKGEKEFLYKGKRYSTAMKPIAGDVVQKRENFTPINDYLATEAAGGKRRQETYGNLGDLYAYFAGQPLKSTTLHYSRYKPTNSKNPNAQYVAIKDDKFIDEVLENYDRVFNRKELLKDEKEIKPNTWAVSGYTRPTTEQLNKNKGTGKSGDLFYEKGKDHVSNSIGRYFLSKGNDDRGNYISYYDIFDRGSGKSDSKGLLTAPYEIYDRIYVKDYGDGKQKRMYYSDKELSELNIDKKDFDTLGLQRELSNRGYKLPNSTKQDGSFDGIWGDETKNALLEYRKSQNKFKQ